MEQVKSICCKLHIEMGLSINSCRDARAMCATVFFCDEFQHALYFVGGINLVCWNRERRLKISPKWMLKNQQWVNCRKTNCSYGQLPQKSTFNRIELNADIMNRLLAIDNRFAWSIWNRWKCVDSSKHGFCNWISCEWRLFFSCSSVLFGFCMSIAPNNATWLWHS